MGQARDEAGNIWETDAQGNPVRLVQQAGAQQMPADPSFPYEGAKAAADPANVQGQNARADRALQLAEEKAVRERAEWLATHNPDGSPKPAPATADKLAEWRGNLTNIATLEQTLASRPRRRCLPTWRRPRG